MTSFSRIRDKLRHREPRIDVRWLVDVQVPQTDNFVGFYTRNMSPSGMCLQGLVPNSVERVRSTRSKLRVRLHLPPPHRPIQFAAMFAWEKEEGGQLLTGWSMRLNRESRKVITEYIHTHPEAVDHSSPRKP